ncbi:EAL domain-containing protein [Achromobacter sp. ACM04]|uniref:EAL domain-containing protein n=1 Tax=Achromobacter TaxID=222 RepID=UPI001782C2DF|nr:MULTISPECIES: EAL domain-containing protein [unclassified Achromobacter]MBD9381592.1 EAL domain-containing protein [Achromobacter sp. ACM02]MBD9421165.1 EAL domain-containing protein [Achromobacter sp. ACM04]
MYHHAAIQSFHALQDALSNRKYLSISRIKIDKTFIDEVVVSKKDQGIVGAIVMLAQALEVDVVAEGVETAEQFAYLRNIGCSAFQGFLFGRPCEVSDFL